MGYQVALGFLTVICIFFIYGACREESVWVEGTKGAVLMIEYKNKMYFLYEASPTANTVEGANVYIPKKE